LNIPAHPGPLHADVSDAAPWRHTTGLVKFLEFPVRKPGLSHRDFHLYWQRHHSPHVMNITGFSRYMRKYVSAHGYEKPVAGLPARLRQSTPFDGASEVTLNSLEDIPAWLGHPLYPELIQPDEQRFLSQEGLGCVLLTREERIVDVALDAPESGLVRLYVLLTRQLRAEREGFHAAVSAQVHKLAAGARRGVLSQVTVNHRLPDPLPLELPPPGVDAVLSLGFTDIEAMRAFVASPEVEALWSSLEAAVADAALTRALVTRVFVVHDELSFQPTAVQARPFSW
jgi:hypothetical protein